jgi:hypothetical protein
VGGVGSSSSSSSLLSRARGWRCIAVDAKAEEEEQQEEGKGASEEAMMRRKRCLRRAADSCVSDLDGRRIEWR